MGSDSDDELGDYLEAPAKRHPASSRPNTSSHSARSKPSSTSNTSATHAGPSKARRTPAPPIPEDPSGSEAEVEADMDDRANGRNKVAARKTVTSANAAMKGRGRPRTAPVVTEEEEDEEEEVSRRARPAKGAAAASSVKRESKVEAELRRRLEEVTRQRDTYAEQFDELVRLKGTEHEMLLADYKRAAEERAKDQGRLIAQLQTQVSHLQDANRRGHSLPLPLMTDPGLERRREQEREEWVDREREWRRKEEELKRQVADSQAMLLRIREDRPIQPALNGHQARSGVPPSTPSGKHGAGPTKNSIVVCLYEDLTNLLVTKCTIEPGQFGEEHTFVCVLTSHGKSLQFSLRTFRVLKEPPEPKDPYVEKVIYNPLELDKETDKGWVERLDFLKEQFTFDRTQMNVFLATAHNKMDLTPEEEEDDAKMEDED
ncbi:hypothetical protein CALCODRAFT_517741 [Calocera cornea HHB12733]|uniref:Monopolin complex subunit Csm1/Pcs1 C-terminal domain-containing protein n=1 Tax=Calocera cornea HHB12733 TaxID=1353952 RepID=A0A165FNM5_9BASI|nr:hypothetical protein CALCODRAFT_517741 [Calocera cornea HHB12733]